MQEHHDFPHRQLGPRGENAGGAKRRTKAGLAAAKARGKRLASRYSPHAGMGAEQFILAITRHLALRCRMPGTLDGNRGRRGFRIPT